MADLVPSPRASGDGKVLTSANGNGIRWRFGERLESLFEERCDALRRAGHGGHPTVDGPTARLTYAELDTLANQVARFLIRQHGVRPGNRIGLLFDDVADGYIGMLAALRAHADPGRVNSGGEIEYLAASTHRSEMGKNQEKSDTTRRGKRRGHLRRTGIGSTQLLPQMASDIRPCGRKLAL